PRQFWSCCPDSPTTKCGRIPELTGPSKRHQITTMNEISSTSRREFIKNTGRFAAASALAGVAIPHVHAAGSSTVQVALIGCGGRGGGAAANALSTNKSGPITLAAMADVFEHRLNDTYSNLKKQHNDLVDVPPDKRFIGFDGYQKAMDSLKPGD